MDNEGIPEYILDQGEYYPIAANYGYSSTGHREDHHSTNGPDGQEYHCTGPINEGLPHVYYPYNPHIPGAMVGVEGSTVAPQQFYAVPSYEIPIPSPVYAPVVLQSRADAFSNSIPHPFINNGPPINKPDSLAAEHSLSPEEVNASVSSEGHRGNNAASNEQNVRSITFVTSQPSSLTDQVRGPQGTQSGVHGGSQVKRAVTSADGSSGSEPRTRGTRSVHRIKPRIHHRGVPEDEKDDQPTSVEQNQGSRTNNLKIPLVVKALTTRAGNPDAHGCITIYPEGYNKEDFPVQYRNAMFFVIKSCGEDDVHKSIKYNVWSSTPSGNKKLYAAYEDAQRIASRDPRGCPVFLFFSVNGSGQFCGVAEMIGLVDFQRDMDFWQQDKWSGTFPLKWHIIKDLPNSLFRHIRLGNNGHKPVTFSRDTQQIPYRRGLGMLKICKNNTSKTSLLDDFLYYEKRQRVMLEERAGLIVKRHEKLQPVPYPPPNVPRNAGLDSLDANTDSKAVDDLKMGLLSINLDKGESSSSVVDSKESANTEPIIVTIGSMPVVLYSGGSSGFSPVIGTNPLRPP